MRARQAWSAGCAAAVLLAAASCAKESPTVGAGPPKPPPELTFVGVSAGSSHSCGVISDGTAYCWGDNQFGQLGSGDTTSSSRPVLVSGGLVFAAVSVGTSTPVA